MGSGLHTRVGAALVRPSRRRWHWMRPGVLSNFKTMEVDESGDIEGVVS
jgi:hypothetical protein